MTVAVLDTDAALAALAPDWAALWARTPGASPFQSPAWLLPWWRAFGTAHPRVAVAWRDGVLAGVLPMYVLEEPGARKLLPMGAGTTDYIDMLGQPARPLLAAVLERARADGIGWCDLMEVPPGSPLRDVSALPGWSMQWDGGSPCPVRLLATPTPIETVRKLRMNRNRARRLGGWTVETATPDTLPALLDVLIRLHQERWTSQGGPGVLSDPAVLAWHRAAAPALLAAGSLRLQVLRVGGELAAAAYALVDARESLFFYLTGFSTAFARVSPGSLLLAEMLDEAVREGRQSAHFLRGREAYKYAWGAVDRLNAGCRIAPT